MRSQENTIFQSYIDRLGGCIIYADPDVKIKRFKSKLVVKKNWITFLKFSLDKDYQLSVKSSLPSVRVVGPSPATVVSAVGELLFHHYFN